MNWIICSEKTGNVNAAASIIKVGKYSDIKKMWEKDIEPKRDNSWGIYDEDFLITAEGHRYWLKPGSAVH